MRKIIIAIDGHSSTGKSTLAKQIASHLGYIHIDSGAMYRAVTLFGINQGMISDTKFDQKALIAQMQNMALEFKTTENHSTKLFLNGEDITSQIRTMKVSDHVSKVATISEIRQKLVKDQRQMGKSKGIVMDGRDIGTVVFPDAELKIFMTASAETRAIRRHKELLSQGHSVNYNTVLNNITSRDFTDSTREDSPLKKAKDALELDNSNLTQQEQLDIVLDWVKTRIKE